MIGYVDKERDTSIELWLFNDKVEFSGWYLALFQYFIMSIFWYYGFSFAISSYLCYSNKELFLFYFRLKLILFFV